MWMMTDNQNPHHLGQSCNWYLARCGQKLIKQREACLQVRQDQGLSTTDIFIDLPYRELVQDPLGTMAKLYQRIDMSFTADLQQAMKVWLESNRQDKYGRHVHSLEPFGLTSEDVSYAWWEYKRYFNQYIL